MANRVFVTGDTHGGNDANKIIKFAETAQLDYDDYIIVCGDCGVVWSKSTLKQSVEFFNNLGAKILFVDGNHENFDMLKKYKEAIKYYKVAVSFSDYNAAYNLSILYRKGLGVAKDEATADYWANKAKQLKK